MRSAIARAPASAGGRRAAAPPMARHSQPRRALAVAANCAAVASKAALPPPRAAAAPLFVAPLAAAAATRAATSAAPTRRRSPKTPCALPSLITTTWSTLPPATHDALCFVLAAAGGYAWVKVFDVLAARGVLDRKLSRKLVHATAGPFLVLTWPLFSAAPHARFVAAAVPALNAARLALVGSGALPDPGLVASVSRQGGKAELLKGPLYYVIVLSALTAAFWRDFPAPALVAVSMMCGGDGLADIVGRRLGKNNPLPWNGSKSWAGSAAMAAGGMGMALGMTAAFQAAGWDVLSSAAGGGAVGGGVAAGAMAAGLVPRLLAICLACTAAESLPANRFVDDNLSVPAVAVGGSLLLFTPPGAVGPGAAALALAAGGVALAVGAANAASAAAEREEEQEEERAKVGLVQEQQHHHQVQQHHHNAHSNGNGAAAAVQPPASSASATAPTRETTR